MLQFFRLTGFAIILLIWVLSLVPLNQITIPGGDKLHHLIAYSSLMMVWVLATPRRTAMQHFWMALAFMAMGLAIECAQGLTTYRFFEWADALANSLGVLLGWALGKLVLQSPIARYAKLVR
ncbi:MAG: VanZ family protein [Pseudomonadota bacterium]